MISGPIDIDGGPVYVGIDSGSRSETVMMLLEAGLLPGIRFVDICNYHETLSTTVTIDLLCSSRDFYLPEWPYDCPDLITVMEPPLASRYLPILVLIWDSIVGWLIPVNATGASRSQKLIPKEWANWFG